MFHRDGYIFISNAIPGSNRGLLEASKYLDIREMGFTNCSELKKIKEQYPGLKKPFISDDKVVDRFNIDQSELVIFFLSREKIKDYNKHKLQNLDQIKEIESLLKSIYYCKTGKYFISQKIWSGFELAWNHWIKENPKYKNDHNRHKLWFRLKYWEKLENNIKNRWEKKAKKLNISVDAGIFDGYRNHIIIYDLNTKNLIDYINIIKESIMDQKSHRIMVHGISNHINPEIEYLVIELFTQTFGQILKLKIDQPNKKKEIVNDKKYLERINYLKRERERERERGLRLERSEDSSDDYSE